jgi:hypothetical protein
MTMSGDAVLAILMAQAEGKGGDLITLRALVEESSQAGARRALGALGLDDEKARRDMDELRELLAAWREAATAVAGAPECHKRRSRRRACAQMDPPEPRRLGLARWD